MADNFWHVHMYVEVTSADVTMGFRQCVLMGPTASPKKRKVLASFNMKKACDMLCGKGQVRTQNLEYQAERHDYSGCATRPVASPRPLFPLLKLGGGTQHDSEEQSLT